MTHTKIIKEHLEKYGYITSFEAFELYGITRLSATIYNLRHDGLTIENEHIKTINRYGRKVSFVKYILRGTEDVRE